MNEQRKRILRLRIERSIDALSKFTAEKANSFARAQGIERIQLKPFVRFTPWQPRQRVMRPCLDDTAATGNYVHDIDRMDRAALIANRAIERMMKC